MSPNFDAVRIVIKKLKVEKDQALCENQVLQNGLNQTKKSIRHLECVNDQLILELETSDETERKLKNETDRLKSCLSSKNKEIVCLQKLNNEIEELEEAICQSKSNLCCVNKRNAKLEEHVAKLEMITNEKNKFICHLEQSMADLDSEVCKMKDAIEHLLEENRCLKLDSKNCGHDVQTAIQYLESLGAKQEVCECTKRKLQEQIKLVQRTLDCNHDALLREKALNSELHLQINIFQNQKNKLNLENLDLHQRNRKAIVKIASSNKRLKRCQRKYYQLEREYQNFKNFIEDFKTEFVANIQDDCLICTIERCNTNE